MYSNELNSLKMILENEIEWANYCSLVLSEIKLSIQEHQDEILYQKLREFEKKSLVLNNLEIERVQIYNKLKSELGLSKEVHFYEFLDIIGDDGGQLAATYKKLKESIIILQSKTWQFDSYLKATTGYMKSIIEQRMESNHLFTYGTNGLDAYSPEHQSILIDISV